MNSFADAIDILNWSKISQEFLWDQLNNYHWVTWIFDYNKPWVRILKHDIQKFVEQLWEAFITTSVNIAWEDSITNLEKLKPEIADKVDYIIDAWICEWRPSVLLDFVWDKIIER
jgi:tRNA A37 threonylcarbamoyladenosine synthetase subunit TsaC/SUA5/YrdC